MISSSLSTQNSDSILTSNAATTVVVGMSGGVDSSVTAALLREQGYRVIGLFMKNWDEAADPSSADSACTSAEDFEDVARVCEKLDIPYYGVNFVREYRDAVFAQFLREYEQGFTPNPDILCNREIKFKVFLEKALQLGGDFLATGHYARVARATDGSQLLRGVDPGKDQSYFLHAITSSALDRTLFPIGDIHKTEVRAIARKYDLATQAKKDSTGICFIGERDFTKFLSQYVQARAGDFRTLAGERVGRHQGSAFYTQGQRKGLGLGGQGEPWFVVGKDTARNIVFVERGVTHPALYAEELTAVEPTWISGKAPWAGSSAEAGARSEPVKFRCTAKIRYRQQDQDCTVIPEENGRLRVFFDQPQRAITQRQSVVFYSGDVCLGGAVIEKQGPTLYERGLAVPSSVDAENSA